MASQHPPISDVLLAYPQQARTRATETDWRATLSLVLAILAVYLGEQFAALWFGATTEGVVSLLFLGHPFVAWPLSLFFHSGLTHLFPNALLLLAVGIEAQRHLTDGQYAGLFLVTAVVSPLVGAATELPFTDQPVGVWGISGFVFALATFLLVHLYLAHDEPFLTDEGFNLRRNPFEVAAILLGVSVVALVVIDIGQAVVNGGAGVNGGHLGGTTIGALLGLRFS